MYSRSSLGFFTNSEFIRMRRCFRLLLQSLFGIATFVPGIALGIRRMHDIGKSGWWLLIGLIPIIGWIVLIVWLATKSDAGSNQWGVTERA